MIIKEENFLSALLKIDQLEIKTQNDTIIDNLSFEIESGDFVAFVGPSGSGKSTILKFLSQLLGPNLHVQGSYYFEGQDVCQINPMELRKEVSYCFQSPSLFGDSVRDNLEFPYKIRSMAFDEDKAKACLEKLKLPASYLNKSINELSGGEKQRVALIRNLLFEPKVLLLDEVTSALDTVTRDHIWQGLNQFRQDNNITIIMVSHHESEQKMADKKIELEAIKKESEADKDE